MKIHRWLLFIIGVAALAITPSVFKDLTPHFKEYDSQLIYLCYAILPAISTIVGYSVFGGIDFLKHKHLLIYLTVGIIYIGWLFFIDTSRTICFMLPALGLAYMLSAFIKQPKEETSYFTENEPLFFKNRPLWFRLIIFTLLIIVITFASYAFGRWGLSNEIKEKMRYGKTISNSK